MEITKTSNEPALGWADVLGQEVQNPPTARTHGHQLFEADGTTHTVSTCENRIKGQFELWVQNNALAGIARCEATGDLERAEKLMSAYNGDQSALEYSWDGKHVRKALQSLHGLSHFLYLLLVRCDPKKTEAKAKELLRKYPRQCGELIRWALGNSPPPDTSSGGVAMG